MADSFRLTFAVFLFFLLFFGGGPPETGGFGRFTSFFVIEFRRAEDLTESFLEFSKAAWGETCAVDDDPAVFGEADSEVFRFFGAVRHVQRSGNLVWVLEWRMEERIHE